MSLDRISLSLLVVGLLAVSSLRELAAAEAVRLKPGVPIMVRSGEAGPVLRAVEDLQRDLKKVLGSDSPRLDSVPADPNAAAIVIAGPASGGKKAGDASTGPEAHAIEVRGQQVILRGADVRGTIYAIYSFSDRFLDIPPWWFWARWEPARRPYIDVPADTALRWNSPQVKWRAWFPNDTDLLSPWIQRDYAGRWNLVVETMLRLKLNTLDIGEFFDDNIRKARVPRDRGLVITTSHHAPLGASLKNWDRFWKARGRATPTLSLTDTASLEDFWRHHIDLARRERLDMVWTIGFRGDGDKGFFKTFADAPADDAGRAKVVEQMLHRQIALLKQATGEAQPPMRTILYDECSYYVGAGLLEPPNEPSLIWNFVAARRDHFPAADLMRYRGGASRPLGYYFNIQFTSTGSHLAEGEGPWKMEKNFRLLLARSPNLVFSVVNSGNTREFPLSLHAHAQMMWNLHFDSDQYVQEFCRRYWGSQSPQVAKLYREFLDAYWQQRPADLDDFPRQYIFHDLRIARATRELLQAARTGQPLDAVLDDRGMGYFRIVPGAEDGDKVQALIAGCGRAAQRFAQVAGECRRLAPELPPGGRPLFDDSLCTQASFMAAASRCLVNAAQGYKVKDDKSAYDRWMRKAETEAKAMRAALDAASKGPFADWYANEKVFGLEETAAMIDRRIRGTVKPAR